MDVLNSEWPYVPSSYSDAGVFQVIVEHETSKPELQGLFSTAETKCEVEKNLWK